MYLTGFADEVSNSLDLQIQATLELGWSRIETRGINGKNLASLTDAEFEDVQKKLQENGITFNCYGSAIANWSKSILDSPESSYEEMRKAIPRMKKLGIPMVRIMSFAVPQEWKPRAFELEDEVVRRVSHLVEMAEDAGILCLHENCMNWGGLSLEHTLRLLERIQSPAFKLVFDTGNPVMSEDVRGKAPYHHQSSWEFYKAVREHIAYVHIKDGIFKDGQQHFTFPGAGDGDVPRILADLVRTGYNGGISIEPHLGMVYHEAGKMSPDESRYQVYIEYGRRVQSLLAGLGITEFE